MRTSVALLISGLAVQQAAATWNRGASNYNTPGYSNNECSDKQKGGYDWSDLKNGDKPGKYDGIFDFGGSWSCSSKFNKRDHITKRTFGGKVLTNTCGKQKPASFSCQQSGGFSVTHIDISVDHDADLDFHYKMKDGSICKQRASCKKDGTTVQNTQCGGAQSVDVYLGKSSEGREDCEIGFHNIGFDCNPSQPYKPPPAYTPAPPKSSESPPKPSSSSPSGQCGGYGQPKCKSSEAPPPPKTTAPPPETSKSPPPPMSTPESSKTPSCGEGNGQLPCGGYNSTSPPSESTPPPSGGCGGYGQPPCESKSSESTPPPAQSTTAPSGGCGGYGQPSCESKSETKPPAESTTASSGGCGGYGKPPCESKSSESTSQPAKSTSSPECGGYGQPSCESKSTPPAQSTPSGECGGYGQPACESKPSASTTSSPPSYTPPAGGYSPPDCLPKCLNTWIQLKTKCKDNTDSGCYCKVAELTDSVIDCVKAYGTDEEIKEALSYFVGICAPQIPENPGIIGKCTDVPIAPPAATPTATQAPVTPAPGQPTTTAAPQPPANMPYTTITYGSSSYTVPQVGFTTETPGAPGVNPTEPIALVPAPTPSSAPANPTAPYPIPSGASGFTSVPFPTGTGAGGAPPSQFTGAASSLNGKAKGVGMVFGAALAFFAL